MTVDRSSLECMRREYETANKKAKETQEKYFLETEKLIAIIRKQKGKIADLNSKTLITCSTLCYYCNS